jgi:hypothetical protein
VGDLTGYHGATVDQAVRLSSSAWKERDLVVTQDVSGDGVTDLVYRSDVSGKLWLRRGIAASGGVNLNSLATAAGSSGGEDNEYGASGWSSSAMPHLMGTPSANGDTVPDIWAVLADGSVRFHAGSKTTLSGSGTKVIARADYWKTRIGIG